jgi:hypothetical protein
LQFGAQKASNTTQKTPTNQRRVLKFPAKNNREFFCGNRELFCNNREFYARLGYLLEEARRATTLNIRLPK